MSNENNQTMDAQTTIDVNNEQLEEFIRIYIEEKSKEALNQLLNHLRNCRVLVPAVINDKKQLIPALLKSPEGTNFFPIYSQKEQIPQEPKAPVILNWPFLAVLQMSNQEMLNIKGIALNPFTQNVVLKEELIHLMDAVEKERAKMLKDLPKDANGMPTPPPGMKAIKMDAKQYAIFERKQFEMRFLPKKLFDEGKVFIDEICVKKEEYVDLLFEESYQQKRMYPYLPEEFSVMVLDISDEKLVVSIDLPNRDIAVSSMLRVYIAWDKKSEKGRYFSIEKGAQENTLGEISDRWEHRSYGAAPVEGAEIQKLLEIIENEEEN